MAFNTVLFWRILASVIATEKHVSFFPRVSVFIGYIHSLGSCSFSEHTSLTVCLKLKQLPFVRDIDG